MRIVLVAIYGLSLGMVFLAYFFYPLVMFWLGKIKTSRGPAGDQRQKPRADNDLPDLTIVVAAHNEQADIANTIRSLLTQDYPREKIQIIVFSDGSSDATVSIVNKFAKQGVALREFKKNLGKTECQNRVVAAVKTELIGFADGNVEWRPLAARFLAETLVDPAVGAVSGRLVLTKNGQPEKQDEGLFRKVDDAIKKGESVLGSVVGAVGPIYMLRTPDYIRLRPTLVSDLVLPVLLAAQEKKVMYNPAAVAVEKASANIWVEYQRQIRMMIQSLASLPVLWQAVSPLKEPLFFVLILIHKYLRWLSVEFLLAALIANVALVIFFNQGIYLGLLVIAVLILGLAVASLALESIKKAPRLTRPLGYFLLLNAASLVGLLGFIKGRRGVTWRTMRS